MNSKIVLATAALAFAATASAVQQQAPSSQYQPRMNPRPIRARDVWGESEELARLNKQLNKPEFKTKVHDAMVRNIKKSRRQSPTPTTLDEEQGMKSKIIVGVATNLITDAVKGWQERRSQSHSEHLTVDQDAEQGAMTDIVVGVATNVISDSVKGWIAKRAHWDEDFETEDEAQNQLSDALARVIQGVLVPLGTQWVKDRAHDIGNWVRNHEDDDEQLLVERTNRFVAQVAAQATAYVMTKMQNEAQMTLSEEDAEQIVPVLVWVGGVLCEVVEGVVVGIAVDSATKFGKKLLGSRIHQETYEDIDPYSSDQHQNMVPTINMWRGIVAKKFGSMDEEQLAWPAGATVGGGSRPNYLTTWDEQQRLQSGRSFQGAGGFSAFEDERFQQRQQQAPQPAVVRPGRFRRPAQKF